jgi:hypothetical protein
MKIEAWAKAGRCGAGVALAALLFLAACTPPPAQSWNKEGGTQDELKRDQKACVAEAGNYGFLMGPTSGPSAAINQQADIYRACMAKMGYTPAPRGALPPAGPEQPAQ